MPCTAFPEAAPLPLHEHRKLCHHWALYRLTCSEYDGLLWRAGNRCEICGRTPEEARQPKLYIDHDARLDWTHVRGLVCARCNSHLRYVDNGFRKPTPEQQRYLDRSWFWTGIPPEHIWMPWLPTSCRDSNCATWSLHNPNPRPPGPSWYSLKERT